MRPSFDEQRYAWRQIPVDDVGYVDAEELLGYEDEALRTLVKEVEERRYRGWRNHRDLWRQELGLDATNRCSVLDYGCGLGIEALQYAKRGNRVWVADINPSSVALAARVLRLFGHEPTGTMIIDESHPLVMPSDGKLVLRELPDDSFDVIHCAGVLHHIPNPMPVVRQFRSWLRPSGELRLMLYSDCGWRLATGTEPPIHSASDPAFMQFVRYFDAVGFFAEWYNESRLRAWFDDLFRVTRFTYITDDERYCVARLEPRP